VSEVRLILGDCLKVLPTLADSSVQCCVTSPPYWGLRDYGHDDQIGLESTPEQYVAQMVAVFREVRRALRDDGTLFLNLGDSYNSPASNQQGRSGGSSGLVSPKYVENGMAGMGRRSEIPCKELKPKDLVGIPWRVAFALQADGWYLRQDIIWAKPNPMPESVRDRCTKAHEYIFLLTKSERYFWDADAIAEPFADERMGNPNGGGAYAREAFAYAGPNSQSGLQKGEWNTDSSKTGKNARSVWTITPKPCPEAHFATFPPELPERCIKAGSRVGDTILEPFMGAGTTGMVAVKHGRNFIGCELNPAYMEIAQRRIAEASNTLWTPQAPRQPDPELYPSQSP
jgi:DNA modification methylase